MNVCDAQAELEEELENAQKETEQTAKKLRKTETRLSDCETGRKRDIQELHLIVAQRSRRLDEADTKHGMQRFSPVFDL